MCSGSNDRALDVLAAEKAIKFASTYGGGCDSIYDHLSDEDKEKYMESHGDDMLSQMDYKVN